jgi:hypothetical protein
MKGFGFFLSSASLVGGFQTGSALPPASNHFWPNIRNEGNCEDHSLLNWNINCLSPDG